jgi:hypothetical protein
MIRLIAIVFIAAIGLASPISSAAIAKLNADDADPTIHGRLSDDDSEKSMDILSRLLQMKSQTRKLDETRHDCGVILFYHIPGTEGTAVNEWLKQLKDANNADYISSIQDTPFTDAVEKNIDSIKRWKIVYAQDNSLSLNFDEALLQKWRDSVTKQQCRFIAATIFADTIDHSVSHTYKKLADCNCTSEEFKSRGYDMDEIPKGGLSDWPLRGQLDYFLFNNAEVDVEIKVNDRVQRGLDILKKHFDLVLLDNRDKLADTVLKVTGWSSPGPIAKKVFGDLIFTKELVSKYSKLVGKNGDGDFIDAVNHVYNNDLGYLMAEFTVQ